MQFLNYHFLLMMVGVVFNEMKGVYSQPDNILGRASQQACASILSASHFASLFYNCKYISLILMSIIYALVLY